VLVLEDAHWFDSSSWDVAREICNTVSPVLVVVATRPTGSDRSGLDWAFDGWDTEMLRLDALTSKETAELLCDRLGVDSIPDQLLSIVMDRAEGNPFFSEELVMALLEAGLFEITDGTCRLTSDDDFLRHIAFPDTLHGVVTSRIDRLATTEQLTIKVAAVIDGCSATSCWGRCTRLRIPGTHSGRSWRTSAGSTSLRSSRTSRISPTCSST